MKRKHQRLSLVVAGVLALGAAVALVMMAFEENIVFFFSPTEMAQKELGPDRRIRLGGLVEENSVVQESGSHVITFRVTDMNKSIPVTYSGLLPDLFREGQGVVAEGYLRNGVFEAQDVLAKHDENYMPPEVADALKKSGHWEEFKEKMEGSETKGGQAGGAAKPQGSY